MLPCRQLRKPRRSGRPVEIWSGCVRIPGVMARQGACLVALRGLVLSPRQAVRLRYRHLNRCRPRKVLVARHSCRRRAMRALGACPGETSSNAVFCRVGLVAWPDSQWEGLVGDPGVAGQLGQECGNWVLEPQVREGQVTLGWASSWGGSLLAVRRPRRGPSLPRCTRLVPQSGG